MISTLFKKKRKVALAAPANPRVPDGTIVWAIGDVHGRLDLLKPLVEVILTDAATRRADRKVVIFLGDYIDRGPESRGVIQYLASLPEDAGIEWRFLKGNHEDTMLEFLDNPTTGPTWCQYGGDATLASYGLQLPQMKHKPAAWKHVADDLDHKLTPRERKFLAGLELSLSIGDYFFSHAGARPGVQLDQQSERDLMWIRNSFLDSDVEFEKVVVHGHTPTEDVYADQRRIGVDTKAYESGRMTAARLHGSSCESLQMESDSEQQVRLRCAPILRLNEENAA